MRPLEAPRQRSIRIVIVSKTPTPLSSANCIKIYGPGSQDGNSATGR